MSGFENECKLSDYADSIPIGNHRLLFIGGFRSAVSWRLLQDAGVTHIVNCTTKVNNLFERYFSYCHIPVNDLPTAHLLSYFDSASDFIERAKGHVLVHCMAGQSRSAAIVMAYLIRYHGCTRNKALKLLQCHRPSVRPNRGFLRQLSLYEYQCWCRRGMNEHPRNDFYTMEWGREAFEFYETYDLPDVNVRYVNRILPIVLRVAEEEPSKDRSVAWLQAVWKALERTLANNQEESSMSTLYHLYLEHHNELRPSIQASKSF